MLLAKSLSWHAIAASEVAPIGYRDSKVPEGPTKPVTHHEETGRFGVKSLTDGEQVEERVVVAKVEQHAGDHTEGQEHARPVRRAG